MKVAILDKKVRRNIALFQHLVQREIGQRERFIQIARKSYLAFVNRKTGDFRFLDLEQASLPAGEWQSIIIRLHPTQEGAFEIYACDDEKCYKCGELEKEAYILLTKTIHILNQICYDPIQNKNPLWVLNHVAQLDCEITEEEEGGHNFIHNAWHLVDRLGAEELLSRQMIGTYLFRKDFYTEVLEEKLSENSPFPLKCITLTYMEIGRKICEKIIVFTNGEWLFYDDDPSLANVTYPTVAKLLATLGQLHLPLEA